MNNLIDIYFWFLIKALILAALTGCMGVIVGYYAGRRKRQTKSYEFQIKQE